MKLEAAPIGSAAPTAQHLRKSMYAIEIPIEPRAMARPRFGKGKTYTSKADVSHKAVMVFHLRKFWGNHAPLEGPLTVSVTFFMPMPPSWAKKKKEVMNSHPHTSKPDCDNLAKSVMDAGNGILWKDDAVIADLRVCKTWAKTGSILIEISEEYIEWMP